MKKETSNPFRLQRSRNDSGPHELPASKERRTVIVRPILRLPAAENTDDNPTSDDDAVSNMSDLELDILAEESDESDDEGMLGQLVRKRLRDIDVLNDPHNTFLVSCQPMTTTDRLLCEAKLEAWKRSAETLLTNGGSEALGVAALADINSSIEDDVKGLGDLQRNGSRLFKISSVVGVIHGLIIFDETEIDGEKTANIQVIQYDPSYARHGNVLNKLMNLFVRELRQERHVEVLKASASTDELTEIFGRLGFDTISD
ncbi:hypothetical protein ElyMa_004431800 [Elysia marginata]|uniref:N-acetyltransferase domain-containing protein n=1 Tax=Elysia marginata TaxID=1093978 RepID=A0AAV4HCI8_9GAST|nr:hypothetical protein ElyMa_004431800 [Elysia marginata]